MPQRMKETDKELELEIKALEQRKSQLLKLARLKREVEELERENTNASDNLTKVKKVADEVCQRFKVPLDRLAMNCRESAIAVPRQVVFYIARELSDIRFNELGKIFHRDRTTALYGHRSVKDRITVDREFCQIVEQLMNACRQRLAAGMVNGCEAHVEN